MCWALGGSGELREIKPGPVLAGAQGSGGQTGLHFVVSLAALATGGCGKGRRWQALERGAFKCMKQLTCALR